MESALPRDRNELTKLGGHDMRHTVLYHQIDYSPIFPMVGIDYKKCRLHSPAGIEAATSGGGIDDKNAAYLLFGGSCVIR